MPQLAGRSQFETVKMLRLSVKGSHYTGSPRILRGLVLGVGWKPTRGLPRLGSFVPSCENYDWFSHKTQKHKVTARNRERVGFRCCS